MGRFSVCSSVRPYVRLFPPQASGIAGWASGLADWGSGLAGWASGLAGWASGLAGWASGLAGWPGGGRRTYGRTNERKISPFYRTSSPIGAAALPPPMKTKEKVEQGKGTADHLMPLGYLFVLSEFFCKYYKALFSMLQKYEKGLDPN